MRPPIDLEKRRAMTPARRKRVLERHGGRCAFLGCTATERLEIDHIIALQLGGKDEDDNLEPLCGPHHAIKTKRDVRMIAKAKRLSGETGSDRKRKAIPSRPFPKGKTTWPKRPFRT